MRIKRSLGRPEGDTGSMETGDDITQGMKYISQLGKILCELSMYSKVNKMSLIAAYTSTKTIWHQSTDKSAFGGATGYSTIC